MSPANSSIISSKHAKKRSTTDTINDMLEKKLKEPIQIKKAFDVGEMRRHLENLTFEDGKFL
jgi:hypothetical protein